MVWFVQPDSSVWFVFSCQTLWVRSVRNCLEMGFKFGVFGSGSFGLPSLVQTQMTIELTETNHYLLTTIYCLLQLYAILVNTCII